jgi:hypothetical protein
LAAIRYTLLLIKSIENQCLTQTITNLVVSCPGSESWRSQRETDAPIAGISDASRRTSSDRPAAGRFLPSSSNLLPFFFQSCGCESHRDEEAAGWLPDRRQGGKCGQPAALPSGRRRLDWAPQGLTTDSYSKHSPLPPPADDNTVFVGGAPAAASPGRPTTFSQGIAARLIFSVHARVSRCSGRAHRRRHVAYLACP